MSEDLSPFLRPGPMVESTDPGVVAYAAKAAGAGGSDKERAIRLYYQVRDGIRYDVYTSSLDVAGLRATRTLELGRGWCVSKAILLAACCRAVGIPARLGYADVRNHMSTKEMRERMQTDVFYWHGYTAIHLEGAWVKSTPAFNVELCEKFGLKPLEFDGVEDSIFHPFDTVGQRHMEYLNFRGEYAEPPLDEMLATFIAEYPHWRERANAAEGDFDAEVAAETAAR
ncbi:MAG: transglutaminase family protein [Alphaproteobacteria bacterium]|nr:transglutaminase family protein [Alphaproteobacteria bacterium]MDP6568136.1 transglutaminase family protein [Alphaproteobacteria bacterium]MDP6816147.1 transglutaminase family protein [Alphaproteobacteria bacterium]